MPEFEIKKPDNQNPGTLDTKPVGEVWEVAEGHYAYHDGNGHTLRIDENGMIFASILPPKHLNAIKRICDPIRIKIV